MATGGVGVTEHCDNGKRIDILPNSKGLAVIITNDYDGPSEKVTLYDTHEDGRVLKETFEFLQFTTHWQKNATEREMKNLVREINSLKHPNYHAHGYRCIVFAFSGHGGDEDVLIGQDDGQIHLQNDIITQLALNGSIAEIPKLFFIDACRGKARKGKTSTPQDDVEKDTAKCGATEMTDADRLTLAQIITELEGNFLVGYATLSKKQAFMNLRRSDSHRKDDKERGSVWMQELAKELRESNDSVQNIMDAVIQKIYRKYIRNFKPKRKIQQPETISRLVCGPLHLQDRNDRLHRQPNPEPRQPNPDLEPREPNPDPEARQPNPDPEARQPNPGPEAQSNFLTRIFGLVGDEDEGTFEQLSGVAFFAR